MARKRIPARDVLHIYRKRRPGQLRDVSWLAPAPVEITFPTPPRGTAATAMNVACITTGAQVWPRALPVLASRRRARGGCARW
ncbi:phage portal protein [Falsiroseomonas selenitidurans]|uniref:phage portal protein n=1 Tax=Falsiroseomonas selenitidurans TaxID=2716335 RepID=UPI0022A7F48F|nr:phage portal protein [Falsiroseomonas selenitidurans]